MRILVIGLRHMGGPMAANLAAAGHHVSGFDLVAEQRATASRTGIAIVESVEAAAGDAEVVLTSLPGPAQVGMIGGQLFTAMPPAAVWIDTSTSDLDRADSLRGPAAEAGIHLVEVPTLIGQSLDEARTTLRDVRLSVQMDYEANADFPENTVFSQEPAAGTKICLLYTSPSPRD